MFRFALWTLALALVATPTLPSIAHGFHGNPQGVSYATLAANYANDVRQQQMKQRIKSAIEGTVIPADEPVRDRAFRSPPGS